MAGAMAHQIYKKLGLSSTRRASRQLELQYLPVKSSEEETDESISVQQLVQPEKPPRTRSSTLCTMLVCGFVALLGVGALTQAAYLEKRASSTDVPQYFQTEPELYAGRRYIQTISVMLLTLNAQSRSHRHGTSTVPSRDKPGSFWCISHLCGQCTS